MPRSKELDASRHAWANILVAPSILRSDFLIANDRVSATPFVMYYQPPEHRIAAVGHRETLDENALAVDLIIRPLLDSPTG